MENNSILITPSQAQKMLGVGRNAMYDLLKEKDFPSFRMGNKFYINKDKLQEWADKQCCKRR